ncbi:hypothetical protein BDM02DRAFT_3138475, partial [Thelephora ganbajun]
GHESPACPLPRTLAHKQCFSCGGIGHIQSDCPTLRIQGQTSNQKCYVGALAYDVNGLSSPSHSTAADLAISRACALSLVPEVV